MPELDESRRTTTTDLANELRPILVRLGRKLRKETTHLGITGGQATLLWQISERPGIGLRELAGLEGITDPTASGLVERLESAKMVERVRSTTDRRRVGLTITAPGRELLNAVRARRTVWLAERLEHLRPSELAAVEAALKPLASLVADRRD